MGSAPAPRSVMSLNLLPETKWNRDPVWTGPLGREQQEFTPATMNLAPPFGRISAGMRSSAVPALRPYISTGIRLIQIGRRATYSICLLTYSTDGASPRAVFAREPRRLLSNSGYLVDRQVF